jgi:hypothetical protein
MRSHRRLRPDCLGAQIELGGDLLRRVALLQKAKHLDLAGREMWGWRYRPVVGAFLDQPEDADHPCTVPERHRAELSGVSGATLEEILDRTHGSRRFLVDVLDEEVRRGRVRREGNRYELVPEAFDEEVIRALAKLQPTDPDASRPYRAAQD